MKKNNSTYKNRALTFFLLFTFLFCLFTANTYAENQSGDGLGVRHKIRTKNGTFYITIDEIVILEGDSWNKYAAERSKDTLFIGVHAVVENESYSYSAQNYIDSFAAVQYFETTDQDGFSLEFCSLSISDGQYEAHAKANKGSKKRALYPYYATKGIKEVSVHFDDGSYATVSFSNETNNTGESKNSDSQAVANETVVPNLDLEKKVLELEERIAIIEKQLEDIIPVSRQTAQEVTSTLAEESTPKPTEEPTIKPTVEPTAKPTTKPTAKPTEKSKQKQDDVRLERMAKAIFDRILKNPQSLQINNISTEDMEEYYYVYVDYSAQNGFGGYTRDTLTIKLDYGLRDTEFAEVVDVGYFFMNYNYREWTITSAMSY